MQISLSSTALHLHWRPLLPQLLGCSHQGSPSLPRPPTSKAARRHGRQQSPSYLLWERPSRPLCAGTPLQAFFAFLFRHACQPKPSQKQGRHRDDMYSPHDLIYAPMMHAWRMHNNGSIATNRRREHACARGGRSSPSPASTATR